MESRCAWLKMTRCVALLLFIFSSGCATAPMSAPAKVIREDRPRMLFIGSSSIFFWKTMEQDFADVPGTILRNGRGSRTMADIAAHVQDEIIETHPDKVLIYAGSIDLHDHDRTPQEVFDDFVGLCDAVHHVLPETPVYFISCKPSIAKWEGIELDQQLNAMVRALAEREKDIVYIDVWNPMLDFDGQPVEMFFAKDKNHLSKEGYKLWTRLIRPYLLSS